MKGFRLLNLCVIRFCVSGCHIISLVVAELAFYYRLLTIQVGRHLTATCRLLICPTSSTKIKHVVARRISIFIMEDDGYSSTSEKVTNPITIKVLAKSPCITHPPNWSDCTAAQQPKIGVRLRKLTDLASSTLWVLFNLFLMFFNFYRSYLHKETCVPLIIYDEASTKNLIDGRTSPYLVVVIGSACLLIP